MTQAPDLSDFTKSEIIESLKEIRHPFEIAVYDSSNYFNLGSIVRSAHNFLASKIYSINLNCFYKPAAGPAKKFEEVTYVSMPEFIEGSSGRSIVAMERRHGQLVTSCLMGFQWPANPIILLGGEKSGICDELLDMACSVVSIPQYGLVNDFNVSIAASVAMYDWINKYYGTQEA